MAIKLIGTTSGQEVDSSSNSKTLKVLTLDDTGRPLQPNYLSLFQAPVTVRQSAATAAGAIVWGILNTSASRTVVIPQVYFQLFFDGTAVATNMKYELAKYTGVTSLTGGSSVTPLLKRSGLAVSGTVTMRVLDTGLTAGGSPVLQGVWPLAASGRVTQTTTVFSATSFNTPFNPGIDLGQNELLAIRQTVVSVIGDNIVGFVDGYEM